LLAKIKEGVRVMNGILWMAQIVLAIVFVNAAWPKVFQQEQLKASMKEGEAMPMGLLAFIGISELLGVAGLILPVLTGILPQLTSAAAVGLAVIMVFAIALHLQRRETPQTLYALVVLALAVVVAYGRGFSLPFFT
jgi:uncharacterized membrane protein YphA (DoxX/SURF4 family)